MTTNNFTTAFYVSQSPAEAFNAINNVRGWWKEDLEGGTNHLNDEFTVHFGDVHRSTQKLVEFIPNEKIVWLVTDSNLNFIKDKQEWTNTRISFDIAEKNNQTQIKFTHIGLVPDGECYNDCSIAWNGYINGSLRSLIMTGKGQPTP
jgi:hypothetical protein